MGSGGTGCRWRRRRRVRSSPGRHPRRVRRIRAAPRRGACLGAPGRRGAGASASAQRRYGSLRQFTGDTEGGLPFLRRSGARVSAADPGELAGMVVRDVADCTRDGARHLADDPVGLPASMTFGALGMVAGLRTGQAAVGPENSCQLEAPLRNKVRHPSVPVGSKDRRGASSWRSDLTARGVKRDEHYRALRGRRRLRGRGRRRSAIYGSTRSSPRATSHYLTRHGSTAAVGATVHGFTVGYWWAAGVFWAGAVICGALVRGGTRLHHEAGQPEPLDEIVSGLI